jgi:hypothetical protein
MGGTRVASVARRRVDPGTRLTQAAAGSPAGASQRDPMSTN